MSAQSSAYVEQVGVENLAELTQSVPSGGLNDAWIVQTGQGGHVARLEQRGGSTATVTQDGFGHRLAGFTLGEADPNAFALSFDGSELVLRQVAGVNSQAFVEQRDGAFAEILQSGSDNLAYLRQGGGAGNQAYIDQAGGSLARITQDGTGNFARVTQTGTGNTAHIYQ
ncbi:hypothetical protein [Rubrivirga sp. IMCC43871]|uniref:hypothetical protein n=1 Tax=Rubrivirga sp. IMCC43871 TaxID=3391575 RepID=UPI003990076D